MLAKYRNLMITMILGGLWHGASWNFVIWGMLHGGALCINHGYRHVRWIFMKSTTGSWIEGAEALFGWALTLWFVCFAWIFFRAGSPVQAISIAKVYAGGASPGRLVIAPGWPIVISLLIAIQLFCRLARPESMVQRMPAFMSGAVIGVMLAIAFTLLPHEARPFVYFQF